jgi:hypothetical protein
MGYWRLMGYGLHFPAHQVGGPAELWDITGYGFSQVWVMTGSNVASSTCLYPAPLRGHRSSIWDVFSLQGEQEGVVSSLTAGSPN